MRSFGSDNNSGVHPRIMDAIVASNRDHAIGYGDDDWTREAEKAVQNLLQNDSIKPYFVFNGTGANVIALQACVSSFHSIICASTAHIAVDECGAPTKLTGCHLKEISTKDGKLTPELVYPHLQGFGVEHQSQPKVIAISQTTELGTLYTPKEIKDLADLAHKNDMYLFVDGTRLPNACAISNLSLKEMTVDCGVDIFTFGGTKNGLMMGEVLIALRPELQKNLKYYRKQTCQLFSKMRYLSAQLIPYFNENIWLENAKKSNAAAQKLANEMSRIKGIKITQKVESNAIFFILPKKITDQLRQHYFFYDWDASRNEMRLVCSWDTTEKDVSDFIDYLTKITD
ncbi:MAG: aminotransferase class V-fold PLP-dependent enzyme [Dysgonamonadaceae bacterium]|jgi:threonine aldolase|nr:aminotransferase class V-fold PLP-dependent enzyme [Dysgonamonadaceae bacterium]MDD3357128.1 aminotransferase class V-fold PLP-dependent enzyme [Dysgonamonadaceae bacterium]MDD3726827.1 aminotransferase class V-fold PLP-dependent enzyme [Dysgonamonadaceae bacterium]MDD4247348.1 aminotransferase class V-fold PLP-dependent enzyme [Dysgonamonadaceae bacterium]MDD4606302.1 aminotransferase class V-fold PLP-dependent enzyme [Dysgonamonadaceae bacterium]